MSICVIITIISIVFIYTNNYPKWKIYDWQKKYEAEITKIEVFGDINKKLNKNIYMDLLKKLDEVINERARYQSTLTYEEFCNRYNSSDKYAINIFFDSEEFFGNDIVSLFKVNNLYTIMYVNYNDSKKIEDTLSKSISQEDYQSIMKYIN